MRSTTQGVTLLQMHDQHSPPAIRIVIDLDADTDPIEGTLIEPERHASAFRGWLALTALLETVRNDGPCNGEPRVA
jgi:hypothetical protein